MTHTASSYRLSAGLSEALHAPGVFLKTLPALPGYEQSLRVLTKAFEGNFTPKTAQKSASDALRSFPFLHALLGSSSAKSFADQDLSVYFRPEFSEALSKEMQPFMSFFEDLYKTFRSLDLEEKPAFLTGLLSEVFPEKPTLYLGDTTIPLLHTKTQTNHKTSVWQCEACLPGLFTAKDLGLIKHFYFLFDDWTAAFLFNRLCEEAGAAPAGIFLGQVAENRPADRQQSAPALFTGASAATQLRPCPKIGSDFLVYEAPGLSVSEKSRKLKHLLRQKSPESVFLLLNSDFLSASEEEKNRRIFLNYAEKLQILKPTLLCVRKRRTVGNTSTVEKYDSEGKQQAYLDEDFAKGRCGPSHFLLNLVREGTFHTVIDTPLKMTGIYKNTSPQGALPEAPNKTLKHAPDKCRRSNVPSLFESEVALLQPPELEPKATFGRVNFLENAFFYPLPELAEIRPGTPLLIFEPLTGQSMLLKSPLHTGFLGKVLIIPFFDKKGKSNLKPEALEMFKDRYQEQKDRQDEENREALAVMTRFEEFERCLLQEDFAALLREFIYYTQENKEAIALQKGLKKPDYALQEYFKKWRERYLHTNRYWQRKGAGAYKNLESKEIMLRYFEEADRALAHLESYFDILTFREALQNIENIEALSAENFFFYLTALLQKSEDLPPEKLPALSNFKQLAEAGKALYELMSGIEEAEPSQVKEIRENTRGALACEDLPAPQALFISAKERWENIGTEAFVPAFAGRPWLEHCLTAFKKADRHRPEQEETLRRELKKRITLCRRVAQWRANLAGK